MDPAQFPHTNQLSKIKECTEMINECKLKLVQKKIVCESSVLEYLEKVMQFEENKLNQQLRNLTKFHHAILHKQNDANSENQSLYKTENDINYIESAIKNYQKYMHNSVFSTISVDWLESSVYLQDKINKCKQQNETLISQLENIKINTVETTQNDMNKLQNKCIQLTEQNVNLKKILNDKQKYIQNDLENKLSKLKEENIFLKKNISTLYERSMKQLSDIQSTLKCSNPITLKLSNVNHEINKIAHDVQPSELMNDLYTNLRCVSKYNQTFIAQQNKLCNEMKSESAKLLNAMEIQNIENEKIRDEEIQKLVEETRINLQKQYGEYNNVCTDKVENIKNESIKYRQHLLHETKEQIKDKKKNFETANNLMREKYEEEILHIKQIYVKKNNKLSNDIEILRKQLITEKQQCETEANHKIAVCHKKMSNEFEEKIAMKEKQIEDRMKMVEMRYEMKMNELVKINDEKITDERAQFKIQQEMLQTEIENLSKNFKKEIQILKRFKPHHIVHVPLNPINNNNNNKSHEINNNSSYRSQLQEYITANNSES